MQQRTRETAQGQPPKNGRPNGRASWPELGRSLLAAWKSGGTVRISENPSAMVAEGTGDRSRSVWRRGCLRLACAAVFCLAALRGEGADTASLSETQVKALFLFNFTRYVEWPEGAFASPTAPLTIGLFGDTELAEPLRTLVAGRRINGHPIVVEDRITAERAANCHILFLGGAGRSELSALLPALSGKPVLAVGENEKFTRLGGIVNFGWRDGKLRLEINTVAAGKARLKLSSKLLGVADVVRHKP